MSNREDLALLTRTTALRVGQSAYASTMLRIDDGDGLYALESAATARTGIEVMTRQAVILARVQGASWAQIGGALGVTKQAAQQRYGS